MRSGAPVRNRRRDAGRYCWSNSRGEGTSPTHLVGFVSSSLSLPSGIVCGKQYSLSCSSHSSRDPSTRLPRVHSRLKDRNRKKRRTGKSQVFFLSPVDPVGFRVHGVKRAIQELLMDVFDLLGIPSVPSGSSSNPIS